MLPSTCNTLLGQVRFVDYGNIVKLLTKSLLTLSEELSRLPPAATAVKILACSGVPDSPEHVYALEKKLLGTKTSLLLVRGDGADHYGRFFVDGQELDFGCLYQDAIDESKSHEATGGAMLTNESLISETAITAADGAVGGVGHTFPVRVNVVDAVDQVWLTSQEDVDALDKLMAELDTLAKEGF